jgi:hypothetical protein
VREEVKEELRRHTRVLAFLKSLGREGRDIVRQILHSPPPPAYHGASYTKDQWRDAVAVALQRFDEEMAAAAAGKTTGTEVAFSFAPGSHELAAIGVLFRPGATKEDLGVDMGRWRELRRTNPIAALVRAQEIAARYRKNAPYLQQALDLRDAWQKS